MWAITLLAAVLLPLSVEAAAPARPGQPYTEAICNSDPNVFFCEDFNYPANFSGTGTNGVWVNAGLSQGANSGAEITGRHIIPANGQGTYTYPVKPTGNAHSVSGCVAPFTAAGCDHVFVANFDSTFDDHVVGNSNMFGQLRFPGGNYVNGMTPATDFYIRFQMYMTSNWKFVGDPKIDVYEYTPYGQGVGQNVVDQKIFFVYPSEVFNTPNGCVPTDCSYDGGFYFTSSSYHDDGLYDNSHSNGNSGARFADALFVRTGTGGNYDFFPLCWFCVRQPTFISYGPYTCRSNGACLSAANNTPTPGQVFRQTRGVWYTLEMRYVLSSTGGAKNGRVVVWVTPQAGAPGGGTTTQIYDSGNTLETCSAVTANNGNCSGLGAILVTSYHNSGELTPLGGQILYDNLVISKAPIGVPSGGGGGAVPGPPGNFRFNKAPINLGVKLVGNVLVPR